MNLTGVESIGTDVFKEYGLSDKKTFNPAEFEELNAAYPKITLLKEEEAKLAQATARVESLDAQLSGVNARLTAIGTLPADAPESLTEREAWLRLKAEKESLDTQVTQVTGDKAARNAEAAALSASVASLRSEMNM